MVGTRKWFWLRWNKVLTAGALLSLVEGSRCQLALWWRPSGWMWIIVFRDWTSPGWGALTSPFPVKTQTVSDKLPRSEEKGPELQTTTVLSRDLSRCPCVFSEIRDDGDKTRLLFTACLLKRTPHITWRGVSMSIVFCVVAMWRHSCDVRYSRSRDQVFYLWKRCQVVFFLFVLFQDSTFSSSETDLHRRP